MSNNQNLYQWFIITAIGGKEDSIVDSLKEKINNFGYNEFVKEFKIFKTNVVTEEILKKDDEKLPKTLKNTKTVKWEVLPDGSYKRIKTKVCNKFPGYIFINMVMDKDLWYCIRNTNGVMGFVGSSGKGALPIPISISEYEMVSDIDQHHNKVNTIIRLLGGNYASCSSDGNVIIRDGFFSPIQYLNQNGTKAINSIVQNYNGIVIYGGDDCVLSLFE